MLQRIVIKTHVFKTESKKVTKNLIFHECFPPNPTTKDKKYQKSTIEL